MNISDPLSRIKRKVHTVEMVLLPLVFKELLSRLPEEVRDYSYLRETAKKDTAAASHIVQRWRHPTNPVSVLKPEAPGKHQFLIAATYADKLPHRVANLLKKNAPFAFLVPTSLLGEIAREPEASSINLSLMLSRILVR